MLILQATDFRKMFLITADPMPSVDANHYQPFSAVYGKQTTDSHCPSLTGSKNHGIPFSPSAQTTRTVGEVVLCKECNFPGVIYAACKLSVLEKVQVKAVLSDYWYIVVQAFRMYCLL